MKFSAIRVSIVALLGLCYSFFACSKNNTTNSNQNNKPLSMTATSVKRGQPLIASLPSSVSTTSVHWSVSPSSAVHITPGNGQAMVLFPSSGHYTVTATYKAADSTYSDSCTGVVTVSDSIAGSPIPTYDTVSLAGDQIKITPTGDSTGDLILLVQSVRSYDCFPTFGWSMTGPSVSSPGPIVFRPIDVVSGSAANSCNGATNPATTYLFINPQSGNWLPNGTYPFSVILNGVTYAGTLIIATNSYTFTWNYTSGVTISPLSISR